MKTEGQRQVGPPSRRQISRRSLICGPSGSKDPTNPPWSILSSKLQSFFDHSLLIRQGKATTPSKSYLECASGDLSRGKSRANQYFIGAFHHFYISN